MCDRQLRSVTNAQSPFVIHHYVGSWEQWGYRNDTRRTKQAWLDMKAIANDYDDTILPWLKDFVDLLGMDKAKILLEGVGVVADGVV
jgi:hypothetical protein